MTRNENWFVDKVHPLVSFLKSLKFPFAETVTVRWQHVAAIWVAAFCGLVFDETAGFVGIVSNDVHFRRGAIDRSVTVEDIS